MDPKDQEIERLHNALRIIVSGATRTKGADTGGWTYAHVREAMLNVGRRELGMAEVDDRIADEVDRVSRAS